MDRRITRPFTALLAGLVLSGFLISCGDRGTEPGVSEESLIHDPWPDKEAEILALLMSGEVGAPRDLYEQVQDDLAAIREIWGEYIPRMMTLSATVPWIPGNLLIGADDTTFAAIRDGTYTAWDSLNQHFEISSIEPKQLFIVLRFRPRLNSEILASYYAELPGINHAYPNYVSPGGKGIHGTASERSRRYEFRHGWKDCPMGCWYWESWYFRADRDGVSYFGHWEEGAWEVFRLRRLPAVGFCAERGEIFSAVVTINTAGSSIFRADILQDGNPATDPCRYEVIGYPECVSLIPVPHRILKQREVSRLDSLFAAIPVEDHEINEVCDPCLITRYEYRHRTEEANPCATASPEFEQSITDLESFLRELAFAP